MKIIRPARGFTLVEVLAALVLIGIVLPVVMHGISLASSLSSVAKRKAEAVILAQSKLDELRVTQSWLNGNLNGDFADDHPEYRWVAEVKDWDDSTLKELDLTVTWTTGAQELHVTLSTLVDSGASQ